MEQQIYELLRQCTVRVTVPGKTGHGTGFFVAPGLILTCAHVLKAAAQSDTFTIEVYWNGQSYPVQFTKLQQEHDLALLHVDLTDHPCVYLHGEAIPFDALYSYGYPDDHRSGDPATFTLEGKAGEQGEQLKFKTGQVRPGMSGAPLLNVRTGHVCGVVQLTRDRNNDLGGRAVPITVVSQVYPELIVQQQHFHQQDRRWTNCLWEVVARTKYLETMIRQYSSVTLPIAPTKGLLFQAIFQPLKLRRDPLAAEDLAREERRALLGETRYSDEDPRRVSLESQRSRTQMRQPFPTVIAENAHDVLNKSSKRSIVILGGPGTGKTVLLKYLSCDYAKKALAEPAAPLPIFISLPHLARSGKTLKEYLTSIIENMTIEERYIHLLWEALKEGHAFVCLDSLDEVSPKERPETIGLINDWASSTKSIYIVGSRFTDYKGGLLKTEQFTEWEIQPMSPTLRQELAKRLLPELYRLICPGEENPAKDSTSSFVSELKQHEQAAAWGENPLLFSLAAIVFVRTGILPPSRVVLYREVIDAVLEIREPGSIGREMLRRVVACLAFELYQEKGRTFTRTDLLRLLPAVRVRQDEQWDTEEMARRIINSGILEVVARDTYGYRHQTFQEYLAAVDLAQRLMSRDPATHTEAWNQAWNKRSYSRWIEVLRLTVGILAQEYGRSGIDTSLRWILKLAEQRINHEGDPGLLGLSLALSSLSEIPKTPQEKVSQIRVLEEQIGIAWIQELLLAVQYGSWGKLERLEYQTKYVKHLSKQVVEKVSTQLKAALKSPNSMARIVGIRVLTQLVDQVPSELLLAIFSEEDEEVREEAIRSIGTVRDKIPTELIFAALHNEDEIKRQIAAEILGQMGKQVPVEALMTALEDESVKVRGAIIKAFGQLGEQAPIEILVAALKNEKLYLRHSAVEALGQLGGLAPIEPLLENLWDAEGGSDELANTLGQLGKRVPIAAVIDALKNGEGNTPLCAAQILGLLGEQAAVEPLIEALQDRDEVLRMEAARSLGQVGKGVPATPLMAALQDENDLVRKEAAEALGYLEDPLVINPLCTALLDEDEEVRETAARALGHLGHLITIDDFFPTLIKDRGYERRAAAEILGQLEQYTAVEALVAALKDEYVFVRRAAVEALGRMGEHAPFQLQIATLEDKNENVYVRGEAAIALGNIGQQIPIEVLLNLLKDDDEDSFIRQNAAETLGKLGRFGQQVPLEVLVEATWDEDSFVRVKAVKALGELAQFGQQVPLEVLVEALQDEWGWVQKAAAIALGKLKRREHIKPLLKALNYMEWPNVIEAAKSLTLLGKSIPVKPFVRDSQAEDAQVRRKACLILGQLGERAPIEPLIAALSDQESSVRGAAAEALGQLGERAPIEPLIAALSDGESFVRSAAVEALGQLGERAPIELLADLLQDESSHVRESALKALGGLGKRPSKISLESMLGDTSSDVRKVAGQMVKKLCPEIIPAVVTEATMILLKQESGRLFCSATQSFFADTIGNINYPSPIFIEYLTHLLDWPYWEVRMKAVRALAKLRRNIPDRTIRRLFELRHESEPLAVREAADDALAEILSLESGFEDDSTF